MIEGRTSGELRYIRIMKEAEDPFWSLVHNKKPQKKRKCLKCGRSITTHSLRLCSFCAVQNSRMAEMYKVLDKDA